MCEEVGRYGFIKPSWDLTLEEWLSLVTGAMSLALLAAPGHVGQIIGETDCTMFWYGFVWKKLEESEMRENLNNFIWNCTWGRSNRK